MTTINNLTIEQMREIVESAPDWPVIGYCIVGNNYIFKQCEHAPCSYSNLDNAWSEEYAIHFVSLNDLRTAITQYDSLSNSSGNEKQSDLSLVNESRDFKVGDFVVLNQSHSQDRVLKIQMFHEDFIRAFVGDSIKYSFGHKTNFRRATPEEIKAGHRLEAERHG